MSRRVVTLLALSAALACGRAAERSSRPPEQETPPGRPTITVAVPVPPPPALPEDEALALGPKSPGSNDWAQFHGGITRAGASRAPAIQRPKVKWKARVGIQGYTNSPLAVGGIVLVPSSGARHNESDPADGLYAFDLATGRRLFFVQLDGDANGAAADASHAYVGSDDGHVYAVELATGAIAWRQSTEGKAYGHPLLLDDLVVSGDAGGYVRAFERATGAARWNVRLSGSIRGGAASDGKRIYAVSQDGELGAFERDGRVLYRRQLDRPTESGERVPIEAYSPPIVTDAALVVPFARDTYYTDAPALLSVSKKSGQTLWHARGPGEFANVRSTPALVGGLLVYGEAYSGDVAAISAHTGRLVYRHTLGGCYFPHWSSPATASDLLYLLRFDGTLHALRPDDGSPVWHFYIGDSARAGATLPSELSADLPCSWEVPLGSPAYSPVAVAADGTILAGTHEGFLYAIGPE